jgi:uncharacterized zinc-type alcohol dehydrogenase-like protein
MIQAWAAKGPKQKLEPFSYDPGPLQPDEVEIAVEYCGICHSDLSMIDNEWGFSSYPLVPGHEVIGRIVALGTGARGLTIGQRVGVGWACGSCMHCDQCLSGNQNLCPEGAGTIVHHQGGFADRVRAQWPWAIPIPDGVDAKEAGPLLCGGVTVFTPFVVYGLKPTDRVGVVGIGGLGHMALKFAAA